MSESRTLSAPVARKALIRFLAAWIFSIVYWPLWVVCICLLSMATLPLMRHAARRRLGQRTIALALGSYMSALEILGIIRVDDTDLRKHATTPGPLIIACNHPALWDAPLVMRRIGRVFCVMKTDLGSNPLFCSGARFAGYVPNSPKLRMIRQAVKRLQEGGRLLLFPEGTRTRREHGLINPFRPGLALLAQQSGAPVLPVFITTSNPYLGKGWPLWKMSEFPVSITFRVGELIEIAPGERVRDFTGRLEQRFRDGLE
jgi:1-acyl-sn-glycerol-3-phosphate acyltransferase